ncbi:DsbA family protein, partial [Patescibacteria group bacterium]|nr:DsbA family protein [Patescibacteria group bacterium]
MDMPSYTPHPVPTKPKPSFLETMPPKTAFIGGFIAAILVLGTIGFIILGSCLLKGGCALPGQAADNNPIVVNDPADTVDTQPAGIPIVTEDDYILGDPNAPITVIEYSDIECPFCERFHPNAQQTVNEYPGQVRWVFRHFPLSFHPQAEPAANAAECAGEQGKFYEFISIMFGDQESLGMDFFKQTATKLGLKMTQFNDCLESEKYIAKIRTQAQGGAAAGVEGTPGSFVIGADGGAVPIRGALPYESVKQIIDSLLG